MQDLNLFGLFLATLVALDIHQVDEELRRIMEEVGPKITAAVMAFLSAGCLSAEHVRVWRRSLDRLCGRSAARSWKWSSIAWSSRIPKACRSDFTYQEQEYSRKQEKSNNRGGIGTCFGTIQPPPLLLRAPPGSA